jgi:hypothetical protein
MAAKKDSELSSFRPLFEKALRAILSAAKRTDLHEILVRSGDLHQAIGGYPPKKGENHQMPVCCAVMRSFMEGKDQEVSSPLKGQGASLMIRYVFPRTIGRSGS